MTLSEFLLAIPTAIKKIRPPTTKLAPIAQRGCHSRPVSDKPMNAIKELKYKNQPL